MKIIDDWVQWEAFVLQILCPYCDKYSIIEKEKQFGKEEIVKCPKCKKKIVLGNEL